MSTAAELELRDIRKCFGTVLALARGARIRILDEPTALAARDAGTGIVYHSADLDEVLAVADHIVVVFDGRAKEVPRDIAAVGRAMVGAA